MKIVQSFWSRPYLQGSSVSTDSQLHAGWPHRILNYYSWSLSCLRLCKFYDQVELVTDDFGRELLIEKLGLPYTSVSLAMNDLDAYDHGLFVLGKVYAYGLQKEPFLHVDGDIFISKAFDDTIASASLAAQNFDKGYPGYAGAARETWNSLCYTPPYLAEVYETQASDCCNAGIFGGHNVAFIQQFARETFSFFEKNQEAVIGSYYHIDPVLINVILEQVLFYYFARHSGEEITYLFPGFPNSPPGIGLFHAAEVNKHYVHCYGFYKGLRASNSFLEWMLQSEYPAQHERIRKLFAASDI